MSAASPRGRRRVRIALALGLGLVLTPLVLELGLRWLLFGDGDLARRLGAGLRHAGDYANGDQHDLYWKLRYLWSAPARRVPCTNPDPLVGWTGYAVRPGEYDQLDAASVGDRRPVLLYGDSFAQCNTPPEQCFQGLLDESDLARGYALLNYGVGGYGLDQTYLLLRESIDAWAGRDPIVIVSLLVESDLDRAVLSFRDWPKPRLRVDGDRLVGPEPVVADTERYLELHPPSAASYLLRLLTYKPGMLPSRLQQALQRRFERTDEKRALNRRLLTAIADELDRRGLSWSFLLFHSEGALEPQTWAPWQEPLVLETAAELGAPVLSTRPFLLAAAGGDAERARRWYGHSGRLAGHLDAIGNAVAFEAVRAAIEALAVGRTPDAAAAESLRPEALLARFERRPRTAVLGLPAELVERGAERLVLLEPAGGGMRLSLRAGELGPTELALWTEGRSEHLRGSLTLAVPGGSTCVPGSARLAVEVDGRATGTFELGPGDAPRELDVSLAGTARVRLTAEYDGPDPDCAWLVVEDARLE